MPGCFPNGTEWDEFEARCCAYCWRDYAFHYGVECEGCPIILAHMTGDANDQTRQAELRAMVKLDAKGVPQCEKYAPLNQPEPAKLTWVRELPTPTERE